MANNLAQTNTIIPQRADLSESEVPNPLNPYLAKIRISEDSTTSGSGLYSVDTSSNSVTLTLTTQDAQESNEIRVKRNGSNDVTVDTEDSATIDNSSTLTLTSNNASRILVYDSDNDDWEIIGKEPGDAGTGVPVEVQDDGSTLTTDAKLIDIIDGLKASEPNTDEVDINIEPSEFAGSHLSDDGSDNLQVAEASQTQKGVSELATSSETDTGTDSNRAITPSAIESSKYGDIITTNGVEFSEGKRVFHDVDNISSNSNTDGSGFYDVDTSGGAVTLTLDSSDATDGSQIIVKRNGGNDLTIDTEGSETIDDSSSIKLSRDDTAAVLIFNSTDSNWELASQPEDAAGTATKGVVELATASETTTGTDATRAVTPDGLAGSDYGKQILSTQVVDSGSSVSTGDGLNGNFLRIPAELDGYNLVEAGALVATAGSGSTTDIQIRNVTDSVDMLSTKLTIDSGEKDSSTAATEESIDTNNDDVATGDHLRVDVDAVPSTPPKGLIITLSFQLP